MISLNILKYLMIAISCLIILNGGVILTPHKELTLEISGEDSSEFKVRVLLFRGASPFNNRNYLSGFKASLMTKKYDIAHIILDSGNKSDCLDIKSTLKEFNRLDLERSKVLDRISTLCE
jgi:hypothetical protein